MKSLSLWMLFLSLVSFEFSHAALLGGVGVGNGMVVAGTNIQNGFRSREEATDFLRTLVPMINRGELPKIKEYIAQGNCTAGKAALENADLMNHYSIDKNQVSKTREVVMHLSIELEGCKTPRRIKDELPLYKR